MLTENYLRNTSFSKAFPLCQKVSDRTDGRAAQSTGSSASCLLGASVPRQSSGPLMVLTSQASDKCAGWVSPLCPKLALAEVIAVGRRIKFLPVRLSPITVNRFRLLCEYGLGSGGAGAL